MPYPFEAFARFSKEKLAVLALILSVVMLAAGGYGYWRLNDQNARLRRQVEGQIPTGMAAVAATSADGGKTWTCPTGYRFLGSVLTEADLSKDSSVFASQDEYRLDTRKGGLCGRLDAH